jgi:hypothetical protein
MAKLYYYRGYVEQLSSYGYIWSEEEPSTVLISGVSYVPASGSLIVERVLEEEEIVKADIITEQEPTGGHYRGEFLKVSTSGVPVGEWAYTDWSKPFDVSLSTACFNLQPSNEGDEFCVELSPNTVIGALTGPVTSGDTVLNVSETVVENMEIGYACKYTYDTVNVVDLGYVIEVDRDNNTITLANPVDHDISPSPTCYIQLSIYMHGPNEIGGPGPYEMGDFIIKGKKFPAGTVFRVCYKNNDPQNTNKVLYIELE